MTTEEEQKIIGGIVLEYLETKKKLVLIKYKAAELSSVLDDAHVRIRAALTSPDCARDWDLSAFLHKLPYSGEVGEVVHEKNQLSFKLDELKDRLHELGVSVR